MEEKLTKQLNIAIGAVFIVAAGVLVWTAANRQAAADSDVALDEKNTVEDEAPVAAEFNALKSMKSLNLADAFESWTPDAKVDVSKVKNVGVTVKGEVAEGYVYARASESGNPLTKWDSFYFKFNNTGGHLFRPESLKTPDGAGTQMLFALNDMPYLPSVPYSEERAPERANLLELLKSGKTVETFAFISSLRQSQIDELTLYYACVKGSDCAIEIR